MENKNIAYYYFNKIRNSARGYAGISFESLPSVTHHHVDFYEIILVTDGEFEHTIHDETTTLPMGTLLLFKPGITHSLYTEPTKNTHFVICVEQNYFEQRIERSFPSFDLNSFQDYIAKSISKEKLRYMEYLGRKLYKQSNIVQSQADEFLLLAISDFIHNNNTLDCDTYVAEIVQKLNNLLYMNMSVEDICSRYPYSQSMLLRQFKNLTGMTIVQYKAEQKMKHACQLLTMTDQRITTIASTLQYDSLGYFLNAFKKYTGMTPTEYRKKHFKLSVDKPEDTNI